MTPAPDRLSAFAMFAVVAATVSAALWTSGPPRALPASAPAGAFSAERAFAHVTALAQAPRPMGSPAHLHAIEYIVAQLNSLGIEVLPIDETPREVRGDVRPIRNIVARIRGAAPTKAMVLMAHHDSVPAGPGAADDASGVAAILETVRALKSGPRLHNDVIVLLTDGEEVGLQGARLFVREHAWMRDVGLVFNFDGVGSGGAVVVPEITVPNGQIVREMAAAAPHLRANSLMRDVQRRMPNDSDLTPFREAGAAGLNFNFTGRYPSYHSAYDVPARLDLRTLQHLGEYALPLVRHFGKLDLTNVEAPDRVYFDVAGLWFVHYPASWAPCLAGALIAVYLAAAWWAVRNWNTRALRVLGAAFAWIAMCFVVCVAAYALVRGLEFGTDRISSAAIPRTFNQHPVHWVADCYLAAFVLAGLAAVLSTLHLLRRHLSPHEIALGGLALCVALAVTATAFLRGGSGLFTWPPFFAVASFLIVYGAPGGPRMGRVRTLAAIGGALPTVLLLAPGIALFNEAMTIRMVFVTLGFAMLAFTLLLPALLYAGETRYRALAAAALVVSATMLVVGTVAIPIRSAQAATRNPEPVSIQ